MSNRVHLLGALGRSSFDPHSATTHFDKRHPLQRGLYSENPTSQEPRAFPPGRPDVAVDRWIAEARFAETSSCAD